MGHGAAVGGEDSLLGPALAQQARGFALGKDHAGAGHRGRLLVHRERKRPHLVDRDLEQVGEDLHTPPGPGSALVVHLEGDHFAPFVATNGLAVLAAHVQDRAHLGSVHEVAASGVAVDLGDGLVREEGDIDLAVLFAGKPDHDQLAGLRADLQEVFNFDEIDLLVLNTASPIARFEAISGRSVFCRDRTTRAAFVSLAAREYEDSMAYWQLGLRYVREIREQG